MDKIKEWNIDFKKISSKVASHLVLSVLCDPQLKDVEIREKGIYGKGRASMERVLHHMQNIDKPLPKEPEPKLRPVATGPIVLKLKRVKS